MSAPWDTGAAETPLHTSPLQYLLAYLECSKIRFAPGGAVGPMLCLRCCSGCMSTCSCALLTISTGHCLTAPRHPPPTHHVSKIFHNRFLKKYFADVYDILCCIEAADWRLEIVLIELFKFCQTISDTILDLSDFTGNIPWSMLCSFESCNPHLYAKCVTSLIQALFEAEMHEWHAREGQCLWDTRWRHWHRVRSHWSCNGQEMMSEGRETAGRGIRGLLRHSAYQNNVLNTV